LLHYLFHVDIWIEDSLRVVDNDTYTTCIHHRPATYKSDILMTTIKGTVGTDIVKETITSLETFPPAKTEVLLDAVGF